MDGESEDWTAYLARSLAQTYDVVRGILSQLPLPISLPRPTHASEEMFTGLIEGMTRALTVLEDMPMDERYRGAIRQMILDWLTALELGIMQTAKPAPWREGAYDYTMARLAGMGQIVLARMFDDDTA